MKKGRTVEPGHYHHRVRRELESGLQWDRTAYLRQIMALFPTSLALLLLIGACPWQAECACRDRSSENTTYSRLLLENSKEIWWCVDPTNRFPGNQRIHESNCIEGVGYINDTQVCAAQTPAAADDECNYTAFADPPNARRLTYSDKPLYVKYYVCNPNYAWLSGAPGRFTQCIGGSWTDIQDQCDDACDPPRDCSDIARMGFNFSDVYRITPSGKMGGVSVDVYCTLSLNDSDNHGWTTAMTLGSALGNGGGIPTQTGGGTPGPLGSNKFFIGIQHLSALAWEDTVERPLVFKIVLQTTSSKPFHATYDDVVIDVNSPYTLLKLGRYHGTPGDAFRSSLNKDFPLNTSSLWWNAETGQKNASLTLKVLFL
ncbi:uncharacterized protein [Macrobrachium rosenbergii]|uniref:uncharacterized protein n=1 Tax=Macrobrachium rosenbergii TaxID=79674 RepID=UPI0034D65D60